MSELGLLEEHRARPWWHLRFESGLEARYREFLRRERRYPRVVLFLIVAIGFGFAPLYEQSLFRVPDELTGFMRLIEFGIAVPLLLLAAAATLSPLPQPIVQAVQTAAVIGYWVSILLIRHLALTTPIEYPPAMLAVAIISVVMFCGFSWYRVAFGAALFFALGIAQEIVYDGGAAGRATYVLLFMAVIAIAGGFVNEATHRIAWLNSHYAEQLSRTDSLSGLSNRMEFNRLFPRLLAQAAREHKAVGVLMLDLDHFKRINDRYGHLFGDEVIVAFTEAVRHHAGHRPLDLKVRYGGEEVVVVWYDVQPEALGEMAERLFEAIRSIRLLAPGTDETVSITPSGGVTWLVPDTLTLPEKVLHHADTLLYRAKEQGRDRLLIEPFPKSG